MRIHHLVAGRVAPPVGPATICHVLLAEHPDGLTLVDSGFSRADLADPRRLGFMRHLVRPVAGFTAADAVEGAGFDIGDVAHIVLTHLDFDHVGGAADFPNAVWHTTATEWTAARTDTARIERTRYRDAQLRDAPEVRTYAGEGDTWRHGLSAHSVLDGISLVPLAGHTRGHAAVALQGEDDLVVHAGDAVFDASSYRAAGVDGRPLTKIASMRAFERAVARIPKRLAANHAVLAELQDDPDVTVVNAHDERVFPG
ncbi:MAG: MBL fold metallo-hydrolase [Aeromicrobium sp.]|uniref:MBL fold metallo-hydrolase n=1 Tax=Aeromicrobium sp. TaxID=1871063 RepID=UPI0039E3B6E3